MKKEPLIVNWDAHLKQSARGLRPLLYLPKLWELAAHIKALVNRQGLSYFVGERTKENCYGKTK